MKAQDVRDRMVDIDRLPTVNEARAEQRAERREQKQEAVQSEWREHVAGEIAGRESMPLTAPALAVVDVATDVTQKLGNFADQLSGATRSTRPNNSARWSRSGSTAERSPRSYAVRILDRRLVQVYFIETGGAGPQAVAAPRIAQESTMLKFIPITKPGVPGLSYAVARTEADEVAARKNAAAQGLLAGTAMPTEPNPQFWSFVDTVSRR